MTVHPIEERAQFAEMVVAEAATLARELFATHEATDTQFKARQEHVTHADYAVENLIAKRLRSHFPQDGIFSEEGARAPGPGLWVVDPIDGTANFAHGIPHFGISIAFLLDSHVQCGAIASPMLHETFVAIRGGGARLGKARLRVSKTESLMDAHVEVGWNLKDGVKEFTDTIANIAAQGAGMVRAGSAALALAYVAAGRLDGYCERHVYAWDVLAGILLVEEAGGRTNHFALEDLALGGPILAAPPRLYDELSQACRIA